MSEDLPKIFVCYKRDDTETVKKLITKLRRNFGSENVWFDRMIPAGEVWQEMIYAQIEQCDVVVFFVSNEALKSPYCRDECEYASDLGKAIIPAVIRSGTSEPMWPPLDKLQLVDFSVFLRSRGKIDKADFEDLIEGIWNAYYKAQNARGVVSTSGGEIPDLSISIQATDVIRNKILSENPQICLEGLNELSDALSSKLGYPPITTWNEKRKQVAENVIAETKLYPAEVELLLGFVYCENEAVAQTALDLLLTMDIFNHEPNDKLLLSVIRHISNKFPHHISRFMTYLLYLPQQVHFARRHESIQILVAEKILNPNAEPNTLEYDLITFFLTGRISPDSDSAFNDITSTQPIHSTEPQ